MRKENKVSLNECKRLAKKYLRVKEQKIIAEKAIKDFKQEFNDKMERYFRQENIRKSLDISYFEESNSDIEDIRVNRIQKVSIDFDAVKLENVLSKQLSKQIIVKKYEIIDYDGLVRYLKDCEVNPKIFKSFLSVSKTVDIQELERLEELGKITKEQIQDCYTTKRQKPYFTVKVKRGNSYGEQEQ